MRILLIISVLCTAFCFASVNTSSDNFVPNSKEGSKNAKNGRIQLGISAGDPTPLSLIVGVGYKSAIFRVQGMAWKNGDEDFWCSARGNLAWTLFNSHPFHIDLGISGGYAFAKAPNGYHQAFNKANNGKYLYPYNYEETLDISADVLVNLYGIFTQISYPLHFFAGNSKPTILWRAGYIFEI